MRLLTVVACACCLLSMAIGAQAITAQLYTDTAPNASGSPLYAGWRSAAFADVAAGSFTNMRSGACPGTTDFTPKEAIVYSTGDLGKRLHWIYWLPGQTKASLAGNFQAKDVCDWDGVDYAGGAVEDGPEVGWFTPSSWIDYDANGDTVIDGVMGTFGNAWWAADNDALPNSTNASPYDETNAADIDAVAGQMAQYQTHWTGVVRFRETGGDWQYVSVRDNLVPEPGCMAAMLMGLAGLAGMAKRRR